MRLKLMRLFSVILISLLISLLISMVTFPLVAASSNIENTNLNTEEAGTYPITFSYTDKETGEVKQKTVYITVVKPRTVKNEIFAEAIDANDIIIKKGELDDITDEQLILITGAHAWSLIDGTTIPISFVELKIVDAIEGVYEATFRTEKGTQTKVTILEMEEIIFLTDEEYINNITIFNKVFEWGRILIVLIVLPLILIIILYIYVRRKVKTTNQILYEYNRKKE